MRHILCAFALLAFAAPALAQSNITVAFSARQTTTLARELVAVNLATCGMLFADPPLRTSCSQSQARNQYCSQMNGSSHPCGSGASASSNVRIFSNVTEMLQARVDEIEAAMRTRQKAADAAAFCARWAALSQAQKDARCTADGQPAGCDLCP